MPDLSIVIPVYNTEEDYLRSCFASIEACVRTGISLETIVVDDGSDPSYGARLSDILAEYDIRASLHRKVNGGQNSARALGAELATGEYLFSWTRRTGLFRASLPVLSRLPWTCVLRFFASITTLWRLMAHCYHIAVSGGAGA